MIADKQKEIQAFTDIDWSELALTMNVLPQQIYWKAKRLQM